MSNRLIISKSWIARDSAGLDANSFLYELSISLPAFRKLSKEWGESPASLAHRYALSIQKVSSVILGVKNTKELQECIEAENKENLNEVQLKELEDLLA